jgi:hypothetical protein
MSEHSHELLKMFLEATVPIQIAELSRHGGISDWHLERVAGYSEMLGSQGDAILYYSKGQTSKMVAVLSECLAVLAFMPGGVKFAGLHFEGTPVYEGEPADTAWLNGLMPEQEPVPEPEREMTWREIFMEDKIGADAVKLGIPPKVYKRMIM